MSQYDVELYQKIEAHIGKKLDLWPCEKDEGTLPKKLLDLYFSSNGVERTSGRSKTNRGAGN